jgi:Arc/MetJ family transcription regulator
MRTTINIDDELLSKAAEYTGVKQKTRLVNMGLKVLVKQAASKRLAALGGTAPEFTVQERDSKYGVDSDLRGDS